MNNGNFKINLKTIPTEIKFLILRKEGPNHASNILPLADFRILTHKNTSERDPLSCTKGKLPAASRRAVPSITLPAGHAWARCVRSTSFAQEKTLAMNLGKHCPLALPSR